MSQDQRIARAKSALAGKWQRLGKYAYICGEWTIAIYLIGGVDKYVLFMKDRRLGVFDDLESACGAARETK